MRIWATPNLHSSRGPAACSEPSATRQRLYMQRVLSPLCPPIALGISPAPGYHASPRICAAPYPHNVDSRKHSESGAFHPRHSLPTRSRINVSAPLTSISVRTFHTLRWMRTRPCKDTVRLLWLRRDSLDQFGSPVHKQRRTHTRTPVRTQVHYELGFAE